MRGRWFLVLVAILMVGFAQLASAASAPAQDTHVAIGPSAVPLNGPWRFHAGDDPHAASPGFDDSAWETVDLTPAPGSHDGDVGLPGYVTGWNQRGHTGYTGFAWYRLDVTVDNPGGRPLALAGPTLVDSTYRLYIDGNDAGGPGDFSGATAGVYSVRPTVFSLPAAVGTHTYHLALRVWMDPVDEAEESGGIHVAPIIGDAESIEHLHQVQWLKTFNGYVVDAAEPFAFVVLAIMVLSLVATRSVRAYGWLAVALVLLALLRVNQVLFYWTPSLSLRGYDIAVTVVLRPLVLAAWTLAWRDWFEVARRPWLRNAVAGLTVAYVILAWLGRPWMPTGHAVAPFADVAISAIRVAFVALYLWVIATGVIRGRTMASYFGALAAILVGIGLFATELNFVGVPGIWFPYGVGVARGQYAYAAFVVVMFGLLLERLACGPTIARKRAPTR